SSSLDLFRVGPSGGIAVANSTSSIGGLTQVSGQQLTVYSGAGTNVALAIRPNSGVTQTADLVQIQNSSGSPILKIDASGNQQFQQASTLSTSAGDLTLQAGGSGILVLNDTVQIPTFGTTDTSALLCRNSSNQIAGCSTSGSGAVFTQGGNSFGAQAVLG